MSQVLKNNTASYMVVYRDNNGFTKKHIFNTFSEASGCAEALKGKGFSIFLNVEFKSKNSAWSGTAYIYNKDTNKRETANKAIVNAITKRKGL